ncbi:three-Cys-motif partner protein TcmP [bacterium]|nr:three-Cys-motif partner protein TcmP [bacterium]
MDKRNKKYFNNEKKLQTDIKHLLLTETFKMSLSIANGKCAAFKTDNNYSYFDLFAGNGEFGNGEQGSPLLVYDIMANHLNSRNYFKNLRMILTDKEVANIKNLNKLLSIKEKQTNDNRIQYIAEAKDWELCSNDIKKCLNASSWGFVFADQYSTELHLQPFIDLLQDSCRLKDVLAFYTYRTLSRQHGRACDNDVDRICKTLNITKEQFETEDFSEKFQSQLIENYSKLKEFIIGVSFPTTVNKKLITADYFYLVFATNSLKLVDSFLNAYEKALKLYGNYAPQHKLFENEDMLNIIIDSNSKNLSELFIYITKNFLSWKNIINNHLFVPTSDYLINKIQELSVQGKIKISAPEEFLYKNDSTKFKKAEISKSRKNMEQLKIEVIEKSSQGKLFP